MKQSLNLRMGHQLSMTPQLLQAIKLLQLSTLDLQQEIQQALESNIMLELEDDEFSSASHTELLHDKKVITWIYFMEVKVRKPIFPIICQLILRGTIFMILNPITNPLLLSMILVQFKKWQF